MEFVRYSRRKFNVLTYTTHTGCVYQTWEPPNLSRSATVLLAKKIFLDIFTEICMSRIFQLPFFFRLAAASVFLSRLSRLLCTIIIVRVFSFSGNIFFFYKFINITYASLYVIWYINFGIIFKNMLQLNNATQPGKKILNFEDPFLMNLIKSD